MSGTGYSPVRSKVCCSSASAKRLCGSCGTSSALRLGYDEFIIIQTTTLKAGII